MHARSNSVQADPTTMDRLIGYVRDEVMPMFQGMPGHVGLSMLADRDSGRCIVTSAWESEEAMRASEDRAAASRREATAMAGADAPQVQEWEVAFMHRVHPAHDGACARVLWGELAADRMDDHRGRTESPVPEETDVRAFDHRPRSPAEPGRGDRLRP